MITAVSWNVDHLKPDSHFDSQTDPHILCILTEYTIFTQQKATQMLRGQYTTRPLGDTYQVQISGAHQKLASSKCPGGGRGERVE